MRLVDKDGAGAGRRAHVGLGVEEKAKLRSRLDILHIGILLDASLFFSNNTERFIGRVLLALRGMFSHARLLSYTHECSPVLNLKLAAS